MTSPDGFDRLPPYSAEAEMCLIGSMILSKEAALEVLGKPVLPFQFWIKDHENAFVAIRDLTQEGKNVDLVILREELRRRKQFDHAGGNAFLTKIMETVPDAAHAMDYADQVVKKYNLRAALSIADEIQRRVYAGRSEAIEILGDCSTAIADITSGSAGHEITMLGDMLEEAYANIGKKANLVSYGFPSFDNNLGGGMDEGETIVVAARPSMGKSTIGRQLGVMIADNEDPVLFISLEERKPKVSRNVLSWWGTVENEKLRRGDVTPSQMKAMRTAIERLKKKPFYFIQGVSRADQIRAIVQSYIIRFGIKVVIVDYVQEIDAGGDNATDRATRASRALNRIAKDFGIRMIMMAQLNREVTKREGNRPTMADIKQTGQIEQDADTIIFLHREDYYRVEEQGYVPTNQAEAIIAKARDGPRGYSIFMNSHLAYQCFSDPISNAARDRQNAIRPMFHDEEPPL